jgi:hypothetical protein
MLGGLRAQCHNGNSAQVVGQVVNLRRVGNPPRAPVNNRRAGCHAALQVARMFRFGKTKWHWAKSPPQAAGLPTSKARNIQIRRSPDSSYRAHMR